MKPYNYLGIFTLMLVTTNSWAYGGSSSSTKACAKPKFSDFVPAENTDVPPNSNFSFTASGNTNPESIIVTVKNLPTTLKINPKNGGNSFEVSGTLPASLKGTDARIAIDATAQSNCNGGGGWLLKITD